MASAEYFRRHRHQRKQWAIAFLGGKCAKPGCERVDDLQFDHKDRHTKKIVVTQMLHYSIERLTEELQKCQLLCREHHAEKTAVDLSEWYESKRSHGHGGYCRGCRCDICLSVRRKWRNTRKIARVVTGPSC